MVRLNAAESVLYMAEICFIGVITRAVFRARYTDCLKSYSLQCLTKSHTTGQYPTKTLASGLDLIDWMHFST